MECDKSPFPNQGEIIREIAKAFGVKGGNKSLDDYARRGDYEYCLRDNILQEVIYNPIAKYVSPKLASFSCSHLSQILNGYLKFVLEIPMPFYTRKQLNRFLAENYFSLLAIPFLTELRKFMGGPEPRFFLSTNSSSLDALFDWLSENIRGWNSVYASFDKDKKDRISSWRKGEELPSLTSIANLASWPKGSSLSDIEWEQIRLLILVGRAMDWFRQSETGMLGVKNIQNVLWGGKPAISRHNQLSGDVRDFYVRYKDIHDIRARLDDLLFEKNGRSKQDQSHIKQLIEQAKQLYSIDVGSSSYFSWIYRYEARWFVFSGNMTKALTLYKKAFESCLYRDGKDQLIIIKEAITVAARNKDRPFLKRLKNQAIVFGWIEPPLSEDGGVNNKRSASNIVEDWEVEQWSGQLSNYFAKKCFFSGVDVSGKVSIGPILDVKGRIKPDYRNLDRRIKVGEGRKVTYPQLIHFLRCKDIDVVEKLLKKGADVNVKSTSNDTPILISILNMDATEPFMSPDDRFFKLISSKEHNNEIVNQRSTKRKLLPLTSAISTGRVDVVKKLLEMGAEVDARGDFEEFTALTKCVDWAHKVRNPQKMIERLKDLQMTTAHADAIRRSGGGIAGLSLDENINFLNNCRKNSLFKAIQEQFMEETLGTINENINISSMIEIAKSLLEAGASPNSEYITGLKGYTPLMLAAELDEVELLSLMLNYGGDPNKAFINPNDGQPANCWDIAKNWRSTGVLRILNQRYD